MALNPSAKPWVPRVERGTEDDRTIYVTFSKGYPINEFQICNFFTRNFGHCIQSVYLHRPDPTQQPLFGKVIFSKRSIPLILMGDEDEKHFRINRRAIWCKRYKRKEERHPQRSSGAST